QRGEELEPYREASRRRQEARRALAADVLAGRMTLREAAGYFRRFHEADLAYPPGTPLPPRDDWFFCESVLDHIWMVVVLPEERSAAAARYYAEAFAAHPQLLSGPSTGHRYRAACAAALAGCGQGQDATDLDETSRAGFRRKALDWLWAALEARQRLLE